MNESEKVKGETTPLQNELSNSPVNQEKEPTDQFWLLNNKKIFPFSKGMNRLIFSLWLVISLFVEIRAWNSNWYTRHYISNYGWGMVALLVLAIFYFVFLWIYKGFKK